MRSKGSKTYNNIQNNNLLITTSHSWLPQILSITNEISSSFKNNCWFLRKFFKETRSINPKFFGSKYWYTLLTLNQFNFIRFCLFSSNSFEISNSLFIKEAAIYWIFSLGKAKESVFLRILSIYKLSSLGVKNFTKSW